MTFFIRSLSFASRRLKNGGRTLPVLSRFLCDKAESKLTSEIENPEHAQNRLKSLLNDAASFDERNPPDDEWTTPVYPEITKRSQAQYSERPKVDPSKTSVLLFPGQGVQYVGMAESLLQFDKVKEMFESASDILRYNLLDLCLHGPKQMLDDTEHCQVAVMVASLAAVEKLRVQCPAAIENCIATAGFSVGEYTALVFSGALSFEDGVRLLKIRGEAMQKASEKCPSGMMTVTLRHDAKINYACAAAREWCTRQEISNAECTVAIFLFPDCRVIAGNQEALKFLEINAKDFGLTRMKYLPVSGAFHTKLMKPAKEVLSKVLRTVDFKRPLIPVHSNVDGKIYRDIDSIKKHLAEQMCQPVKWEQIMHIIFERSQGTAFPIIYECGPKKSLSTILRKNNEKAYRNCVSIAA